MDEWAIRAVSVGRRETKLYAGNTTLVAGVQLNLQPSSERESAFELMLSALAAYVIEGFRAQLEKRGVNPFGLELLLKAKLDNPLVHLGVIGESGDPGASSITATIYVSAEAEEPDLEQALDDALARAPVFSTLKRAVMIDLKLAVLP